MNVALFALVTAAIALTITSVLVFISQRSTTSSRRTERSTGSMMTDTGTLERVKALEAEVRTLQLEWSDTFSKLSRLAGRLAKTNALDNPKPAQVESGTMNRHAIAARAKESQDAR